MFFPTTGILFTTCIIYPRHAYLFYDLFLDMNFIFHKYMFSMTCILCTTTLCTRG